MHPGLIRILVFVFIPLVTTAQSVHRADSLRGLLVKHELPDTVRLGLLLEITQTYSHNHYDEVIRYGNEGVMLAKQLKREKDKAKFLHAIASAEYFKGNYDKAAAKLYEAIGILERKEDQKLLAFALNDLAKLFRKTRDLNRSIDLYNRAINIFKALKDTFGISMILNESGVVFEYQKEYDEALKRYKASLELTILRYDSVGIGYALSNIGSLYALMRRFDESEKYLIAALQVRTQLADTFMLALNYSDLAGMYAQSNRNDQAIENYRKSNQFAMMLTYRELISANMKELSIIEKKRGNYENALDYYTQHVALKDSIFNIEKTAQIGELATKYETEKKDREIDAQASEIKTKRWQLLISLIIVLATIFIATLLYNRFRLKQKLVLDSTLMQQQELRNKAIIEAEEKERTRIARELHDGIGQQLSAVKMNLSAFEAGYKTVPEEIRGQRLRDLLAMIDESVKEVRSISHNMMPNALMRNGLSAAVREFVNKISSSDLIKVNLQILGLNERLESSTESVLYRVLQECVSNIVKHGEATTIGIQLLRYEHRLNMIVEDNGKGFDISLLNDFEGIGIKNMISRVKYLNGTVEFDSSAGNGTTVIIDIPLAKPMDMPPIS